MERIDTELPGVCLIRPRVFEDQRGFFMETWQARQFQEAGIDASFVQDNFSRSSRGTLRGLHYQIQQAQGKLVRVVQGEVMDVAVDLRQGSVRLDGEDITGLSPQARVAKGTRIIEAIALGPRAEDATLAFLEASYGDGDPEIYLLALKKSGLSPDQCIVIEDSRNGLLAAQAAGLRSVATTNIYTENEDLSPASIVVTSLGDPDGEKGVLKQSAKPFEFDGVLHAEQLIEFFSGLTQK